MMHNKEDEIIRNMLNESASIVEINDEPTILTLYDTINVLQNKNPEWRKDKFCQMILCWQASIFNENHAEEIINEKCSELLSLYFEYREQKTFQGFPLPEYFGIDALEYVKPKTYPENYERFGCSPVRNAYFELKD